MSVISRSSENREDFSVAIAKENNTSTATTNSVQKEVNVTPEVVATAQAKRGFESLTGRIFLHREGDSTSKTWAVRVLAVILLPLTILTAVFDAGRFAAYKAGVTDGQSYSLINMTSNACRSAAAKVSSTYNSYVNPVRTIDGDNKAAGKVVNKLIKELINAYDELNAPRFSDPRALKAAQKIPEIQQRLTNEINGMVQRNTKSTEDFPRTLGLARAVVENNIMIAAGNRVYIANKHVRFGQPAMLSSVINSEFNRAFESNRPTLASIFVQVARQGSDVIAGLKFGVESGILTSEQAKVTLTNHAVTVFSRGLEEGLKTAEQVTEGFVGEAAKQGLMTRVEANIAAMNATAGISDLAAGAARDVACTITEATSDQEIGYQLTKTAEKLIQQGRLSEEGESQFLSEAKAKVQVVRDRIDAERQARVQLEQESRELEAAQKVEVAKKAELANTQGALIGSFSGFLSMIGDKQKTLVELHQKHDDLRGELKATRIEYLSLQNRTTQINGEEVSLLRAAQIYHAEVARITGLDVTDAERQSQLEELAKQGFDQNTVEIINQLTTFTTNTIMPMILGMSAVADQITVLHDEVKQNLAVLSVFRTNNISVLEKDQKEGVALQEKPVSLLQKRLDIQHDKLLRIPYIQRMKGREPVVATDVQENRAEVARILEEYNKPSAPKVIATVQPEPNIFRQAVTYPFSKVSEILSYLHGNTTQAVEDQGEVEVVKVEIEA